MKPRSFAAEITGRPRNSHRQRRNATEEPNVNPEMPDAQVIDPYASNRRPDDIRLALAKGTSTQQIGRAQAGDAHLLNGRPLGSSRSAAHLMPSINSSREVASTEAHAIYRSSGANVGLCADGGYHPSVDLAEAACRPFQSPQAADRRGNVSLLARARTRTWSRNPLHIIAGNSANSFLPGAPA